MLWNVITRGKGMSGIFYIVYRDKMYNPSHKTECNYNGVCPLREPHSESPLNNLKIL